MTRARAVLVLLVVLAATGFLVQSRAHPITAPRQAFGAAIGDDYFLATYDQLASYWQRLASESDRLALVDIGRTGEGRTQWMAVISAPGNLARLRHYRDITRRLTRADGIGETEARALASEGKAIVWIDGGLHAEEVLGAQQLIALVHDLVSRSDSETRRILREVIVLVVDANPDGHERVARWYMREKDPRRRQLAGALERGRDYAGHDVGHDVGHDAGHDVGHNVGHDVGHDRNRDFYLGSQPETININRVLYREWFPQIVYDHHQPGPPGATMFVPPFAGPFSARIDPLVRAGVERIGEAMRLRLAAEGKAGVTTRSGGPYSASWNGSLRTTAYFHNQIGLLTETSGGPTPAWVSLASPTQVAERDRAEPIAPRMWHFKDSMAYEMAANRAVLDLAARERETLLYNAYRMGRHAIARGHEHTRGYIVSSDQPDFLTATKFVDALVKAGVSVQRASSGFVVEGRRYPAGSFVVRTTQAFGPHVFDMFEPQDSRSDRGAGPGPEPYDIAGWTLALQMGIDFDRVTHAFEGPFDDVAEVRVPAGRVSGAASPAGFMFAHAQNDAFTVVNRLVKAGERVYWPADRTSGGYAGGTGAMYATAGPATRSRLVRAAVDLGVTFTAVSSPPVGRALALRPVRVGVWGTDGDPGSSGWIRWVLDQFECPFEIVDASALGDGARPARVDAIILPDEAFPLDTMEWARVLPRLRRFVEQGGTLIAMGDATAIASSWGLALTANYPAAGRDTRDGFDVPGSILRVQVDHTVPLGYGFESEVDTFFWNSPTFTLRANPPQPIQVVGWFGGPAPLRSGTARGQARLEGTAAVVDVPLGRGHVVLLSPRVTFRAQSHGTFKFLFNALSSATAVEVRRVPN